MKLVDVKKYLNLFGSILAQFPFGVVYLTGSVSPYIISHLHAKGKYEPDDVGTEVWITSLFFVGMLASVVTSFLERHLGTRLTVLIGSIIVDISYCLTYFAVQHSIVLVSITLGLIPGIGVAQAMNASISNVSKWIPKHIGFGVCLVLTGFGTGVIFINVLLTHYVNPLVLTTNTSLGSINVFTDKDIIDRTPYLFLLLGGISVAIHVVAVPMIIEAPKIGEDEQYISLDEDEDLKSKTLCNGSAISAYEMDLTEVIKQPAIYILTISGLLYLSPSIVILAAYKTFGELFIQDDLLLTKIGGLSVLLGAIMRPCFGWLVDQISHKSIAAVATGPLMSYILQSLGWFYLFLIMGLAPILGMILMMFWFNLKLPDGSYV